MNEEVRRLLEDFVELVDPIVDDGHGCFCQFCSAESQDRYGFFVHRPECLIERANRMLQGVDLDDRK